MPLDPTKRRAYYNRCSPVEPLAPHDQRNFDIDTECSAEVRGGSWVERLGKLSVEHGDHLEIVDRAIQNNLVYRYLNDSEWFDVAPALGRMLAEYAQSLPPVTGIETTELR